MKFIIPQKEFAAAVANVKQAVSIKAVMPALKSILLEVQGTTLSLTATDLNITICTAIDISGGENGQALVDAKLLGEIVAKLPNALVSVSTDNSMVSISALSSEFNIMSMDAEDFPSVPDVGERATFSMRSDTFRSLVGGTAFAASIDDKHGVLVGCLLKISEGGADMVALDGFRMAIAHADVDVDGEYSAIIPATSLTTVASIVKSTDEAELTVGLTEKFARFEIGTTTTVTTRLLEGSFVKYEDILPKSFNTSIIVSRSDFVSALDRAHLFATEGKNNLVKFDIQGETNTMLITSRASGGSGREEVAVDFDGKPLVIGFNDKYVLDALKNISQDEVRIEFTSPNSASIIKSVDDDTFTHLVLPVRLKEA